MSFRAKRLHLRLFLEGQEVPVISAVVTGGINAPATASIQIVPTDDIHRLLPRTLVHLFFFDLYPPDEASLVLGNADSVGYSGVSDKDMELLGDNYRLLFAGEMLGYGFKKSGRQRVAFLQCLDFSSYWDTAKQYFHTGGTNSASSRAAAFVGSASIGFAEGDKDSTTPTQAIMNILKSRSATVPALDGLLGGIVHLLESIGGVYNGFSKFRGLNDFFSAAELRLGLTQMLGAAAKDTSSKNLFNHGSFQKWVQQTLAKNRNLVSFRQILDLLLAKIYHEYVSIPAPAYRPETDIVVTVNKAGKLIIPDNLKDCVSKRIGHLTRYLAANKAFDRDPGSIKRADEDLRKYYASYSVCMSTISRGTVGDKRLQNLNEGAREDEIFLRTVNNGGTARNVLNNVIMALKYYKRGARSRSTHKVKKNAKVLDRLVTHIFRPNIFFAPPPRCNVLWPDMYDSFSYKRGYMQEVTRLQLVGQKEWKRDSALGIEGGKKDTYWAPNIPNLAGKLAAVNAKKGIRYLMSHEIHTGIIPQFDHISDIGAFQKIDQAQGGRNKIPYMQRIANYNFFLYRFGPRTGSVSTPFHPYLVVGMPALIIDRYRSDTVRSSLGVYPTQYLGVIHSITHSISQEGGVTSVQLSHCRTHDEEMEFLGPFIKSWRQKIGSKFIATQLLSEAVDEAGGIIPKGTLKDPTKILGTKVHGKGGKITKILSWHQTDLEIEEGPLSETFRDRQAVVNITEDIIATRTRKYPPEQAMFPGWMSPIYTNLNIGREFYRDLIGTGSICDPIQIGTADKNRVREGIPHLPDSLSSKQANSLTKGKLEEYKSRTRNEFKLDPGEFGPPHDEAAATVELGATVEQAVNAMVDVYKSLKEDDQDIDAFFKSYGWRPVASLKEVLGTYDYDPDRNFGVRGFHSLAFGDWENLKHLNHVEARRLGGRGTLRKVDGGADPRKSRFLRVLAYVAVLEEDKGALG